jgi:flagellar biosynthesis protein FliQ
MSAAVQLVHDGFALVLAIALPMLGAALAGVLAAAVVARLMGIQDAASSALARAAAMLAVLAVLGATWADEVRAFTASSWATLAESGQPRP